MTSPVHLVKRALSSFSNRLPHDVNRAIAVLDSDEMQLWQSMQGRDQSHSLIVLERFERFCPDATQAEKAAALLHDLGKTRSGLGWFTRILATLVGSRGVRFAEYHDHERIGAEMLLQISHARTIELVSGTATDAVADALRDADDI